MTKRFGVPTLIAALVIGSAMPMTASAAGPAAAGPGGAKGPASPSSPPPRSGQQGGAPAPTGSPLSQDAAARSRMHECGHQWSSMKKAGTTGTLTWKEFSSTCLVVSR